MRATTWAGRADFTTHVSFPSQVVCLVSCAPQYIEAGNSEHARDLGPKGSDAHKAAVTGDTVCTIRKKSWLFRRHTTLMCQASAAVLPVFHVCVPCLCVLDPDIGL